MGAYLSEPITKKETESDENAFLRVASASMQGWRVSQEDAHNAILDYDKHSSYFAVYDGHGGHEVAVYTSKKLPGFIKENSDYLKGNVHKALIDSFVEFDRTITDREVVQELLRIKGNDFDSGEHDPEEVDHLYKEATMSIEEVMAKYAEDGQARARPTLKNRAIDGLVAGSSKSQKPISPFLRAKTVSVTAAGEKREGDEMPAAKIDFTRGEGNDPPEETGDAKVEVKTEANGSKSDAEENPKEGGKGDGEENGKEGVQQDVQQDGREDVEGDLKEETKESEAKEEVEETIKEEEEPKEKPEGIQTNGHHVEDAQENGTTKQSKGKGKGKGKGKSSAIGKSSPHLDDEETTAEPVKKKSPKKTADELYRNILNEDPGEEEESSDEDDEVFGIGQESDSDDDVDEEGDDDDTDILEEEEEDEEDSEDEDDVEIDGEEYIGGEFNEEPGNDSGCTAVVALLQGKTLYVANAGDSRCVVCRDGRAVEMSFDHKPEDEPEQTRIEKAGGKVTADGRVNGGLNLSRAIGDHAYKTKKALPLQEQMISPVPDVKTLDLDVKTDSFILLACDGIWNSLTSQQVVDFISERLKKLSDRDDPTQRELTTICEELFHKCLAPDTTGDGTGCDNMTAVLVKIRPAFDNVISGNGEETSASANVPEDSGTSSATGAEASTGKRPSSEESQEGSEAKRAKIEEDAGESS